MKKPSAIVETVLTKHKLRTFLALQQLVILFLDQFPTLYPVAHLCIQVLCQPLTDREVNLLEPQQYPHDTRHKVTLHIVHKQPHHQKFFLMAHHRQPLGQFHLLSQLLWYEVLYPRQVHQNRRLEDKHSFPTCHLKYHQVPLPFQL